MEIVVDIRREGAFTDLPHAKMSLHVALPVLNAEWCSVIVM